MSQKIIWNEPVSTSVSNVEISWCDTKYGSYTVATTMDATSDGAVKSSSNTWITSYNDATGNKTYWYKIRFYDGTYYSDYSEPVTGIEETGLCTISEIKDVLDTVGRWSDSEVQDIINEVTEEIYEEMGRPIASAVSVIGKIDSTYQSDYYVGERSVYRVDRVFYGTTSKNELFLDDGFTTNLGQGMIRIATTGTSAVTLDTTCDVEIEYVPKIINRYAKYLTAKRLLEQIDTTSGGEISKELGVIDAKLNTTEQLLKNKYCMAITTDYEGYDSKYGVNKKRIVQDHDKNNYLGRYGWD